MQVPRFPARPTVDMPETPLGEGRPGAPRMRPQNYEEELLFRRITQEQDERYARRLQDWREDERDDDFREGFGDITALGNAAGHFLNDDFRLRPRVPQPPPPPPPLDPSPMFDRAPAAAGDYVHGVNRARGVRATSMSRLADRFTARPPPPPPLPTAATMPLPAVVGLAPGPQIRRHTVEATETGARTVERPSGRVVRPVVYAEPEEMMTGGAGPPPQPHPQAVPVIRKQHVREPPKGPVLSALAGLSKGGSYGSRVEEWRMYVGGGGIMEPAAEIAS